MESILAWGIEFIAWLQQPESPALQAFFALVTKFGGSFYLYMFPFLFWCVDFRTAIRVGGVFTLTLLINTTLKEWIGQPRPFQMDPRVISEGEQGYGLAGRIGIAVGVGLAVFLFDALLVRDHGNLNAGAAGFIAGGGSRDRAGEALPRLRWARAMVAAGPAIHPGHGAHADDAGPLPRHRRARRLRGPTRHRVRPGAPGPLADIRRAVDLRVGAVEPKNLSNASEARAYSLGWVLTRWPRHDTGCWRPG